MSLRYTYDEWEKKGIELFGKDKKKWKFKCPVCGYIASAQNYLNINAPIGAIGFSCIGRWKDNPKDALSLKKGEKGPCNYSGEGLFQLNPIEIIDDKGEIHKYFDFSYPPKLSPDYPQGKNDVDK